MTRPQAVATGSTLCGRRHSLIRDEEIQSAMTSRFSHIAYIRCMCLTQCRKEQIVKHAFLSRVIKLCNLRNQREEGGGG